MFSLRKKVSDEKAQPLLAQEQKRLSYSFFKKRKPTPDSLPLPLKQIIFSYLMEPTIAYISKAEELLGKDFVKPFNKSIEKYILPLRDIPLIEDVLKNCKNKKTPNISFLVKDVFEVILSDIKTYPYNIQLNLLIDFYQSNDNPKKLELIDYANNPALQIIKSKLQQLRDQATKLGNVNQAPRDRGIFSWDAMYLKEVISTIIEDIIINAFISDKNDSDKFYFSGEIKKESVNQDCVIDIDRGNFEIANQAPETRFTEIENKYDYNAFKKSCGVKFGFTALGLLGLAGVLIMAIDNQNWRSIKLGGTFLLFASYLVVAGWIVLACQKHDDRRALSFLNTMNQRFQEIEEKERNEEEKTPSSTPYLSP